MGWLFKEYIKGELQSTEKVSLNKAYQAAGEAMEYLKFAVTSRQKDVFDAQVIARRERRVSKSQLNSRGNQIALPK